LNTLKSYQKKYLRGLAHGIKPTVIIGNKGFTASVARSIDETLNSHELIKVKFIDFKEKAQKQNISSAIEQKNACEMAGMIGHTAIFYRRHNDPQKRKIKLPQREP
jgi:RNA-binding protein